MDYVSVAILILRLYLFTNFQICLYLENSILGCKSPGRQVAEIAKSRFTLKSTVLRANPHDIKEMELKMANSIKDYNMQSTGATNKINIDKFVFDKLDDDWFYVIHDNGIEEDVEAVGGNGFLMVWYMEIDFDNFVINNFEQRPNSKVIMDEDHHKITLTNLVAYTNNQDIERIEELVSNEDPDECDGKIESKIVLKNNKEINPIGEFII